MLRRKSGAGRGRGRLRGLGGPARCRPSCRSSRRRTSYKVGFAQTESNNPWRIAQTESMQAEADEARAPARLHRRRRLGRQAGRRRELDDRAGR